MILLNIVVFCVIWSLIGIPFLLSFGTHCKIKSNGKKIFLIVFAGPIAWIFALIVYASCKIENWLEK